MNHVHPRHGAPGPPRDGSRLFSFHPVRRGRRGFTLLEMLMVLVIIAILAGLSMPAVQSAFTEQAVRRDAHQLALLVKTGMIRSSEQHRAYVIELTDSTMALHPVGEAAADPGASSDSSASDDDTSANNSAPVNVDVTNSLDAANSLLTPDPQKVGAWMPIPPGTQWIFQPGELCPATRVRVARGKAWLEISFNALTGNEENESDYLP